MASILKFMIIVSALAIVFFLFSFLCQNKIEHKRIEKELSLHIYKKNSRIILQICKTTLVFQKEMEK